MIFFLSFALASMAPASEEPTENGGDRVEQPLTPEEMRSLKDKIIKLKDELKVNRVTCIDEHSRSPDLHGEAIAKKVSMLQESHLAGDIAADLPMHEIARERLDVAESWMDAYCLNPSRHSSLTRALRFILDAETANTDPNSHLAVELHQTFLRYRQLLPASPSLPPPDVKSSAAPSLTTSMLPTNARPPPDIPKVPIFIFRLEGGYGYVDLNRDTSSTVNSGYLNGSILAQYARPKIALIVGPYASWIHGKARPSDADVTVYDFGAHLELALSMGAATRDWFGFHPFLEIGGGRVRPGRSPTGDVDENIGDERTGLFIGPGVSFCLFQAIVCPTLRFKMLPETFFRKTTGQVPSFSVQIGLAVQLRRYLKRLTRR